MKCSVRDLWNERNNRQHNSIHNTATMCCQKCHTEPNKTIVFRQKTGYHMIFIAAFKERTIEMRCRPGCFKISIILFTTFFKFPGWFETKYLSYLTSVVGP